MDDPILAARAKQGNMAAFEALARRYQDVTFRAAYLITGNTADAEDAVQEALFKAYCAMPGFREQAPFRPWLLRIVTNEALNRRRSATRYARLVLRSVTASAGNLEQADAGPDTLVLASERREMVVAAVSLLPEMDRIVLAYHYFLDLSVAEMAEILSCPPRTVRTRIKRALQRLREQLLKTQGAAMDKELSRG